MRSCQAALHGLSGKTDTRPAKSHQNQLLLRPGSAGTELFQELQSPGFPVSGRKNPAVTADLPGSRGSAGILSAGTQTPFFPLWSMGDSAATWFIHQVIRPFPIKTAVGRRCASHRFRQPVNRKHFERGSAWFFLPGAARAAAASTAGSGIRAFLPLKKRFIVSCRKKPGLFL